ncbi:MAG: hypothetical protein ACFFBV_13220 [Promethearchaeota archaeon]
MVEIEDFIESKKNELTDSIKSDRPKRILDIYKEVRHKVSDINKFYDFVGESFAMNPDFFMTRFSKIYNKNIESLLNMQELIEMEESILRKYSLYQGEEIKASCKGEIGIGSGKMVGRMFLTNYRILLQGRSKSKGVPGLTIGILDVPLLKAMQKRIVKKMQERMSDLTSEELPCFGNQYPMFGVYKMKLKGKSVHYKAKVGNKKYLFIVKPYGDRARELAPLIYNTITEASQFFG